MSQLANQQDVTAYVAANQADIAGLKSNIVVDLSTRYTTFYANLSAALTALNSDTTTDATAIKKAGVSIKFINSTTNKYEQWNLKASSWSTNTSDWALDADGSVTSGKLKLPFELEKPSANEYVTQASQIGMYDESLLEVIEDAMLETESYDYSDFTVGQYYTLTGTTPSNPTAASGFSSFVTSVKAGQKIKLKTVGASNARAYALTDNNKTILSVAPANANYSSGIELQVEQDGYLYVNDNNVAFTGTSVVII